MTSRRRMYGVKFSDGTIVQVRANSHLAAETLAHNAKGKVIDSSWPIGPVYDENGSQRSHNGLVGYLQQLHA